MSYPHFVLFDLVYREARSETRRAQAKRRPRSDPHPVVEVEGLTQRLRSALAAGLITLATRIEPAAASAD